MLEPDVAGDDEDDDDDDDEVEFLGARWDLDQVVGEPGTAPAEPTR